MNTLRAIFFSVIFVFVITACAKTPINPGDKIGDFLITTGTIDEVTFIYELDESDTPSNETEIEIPWGTKIVSTYGIYDSSYSGKLEEVWNKSTYKLEINGQPVNLAAFGTIDKQHPMVGTMRFYNVVINATAPGKLTVRHAGNIGDQDLDDTLTMIFLAPAQ